MPEQNDEENTAIHGSTAVAYDEVHFIRMPSTPSKARSQRHHVSHYYGGIRRQVEELVKDFGPHTIWDLPQTRSTCWDMDAAAMATVASRRQFLYERRHPDRLTWVFVLVPSVLVAISIKRVPLTTRVKGAQQTRKYISV